MAERRDHYAGHDHANTARFIGLVWIVFGAGLLGLVPVAAAGHAVPLAVGLASGATALLGGLALTRGWHPGYGAMLAFGYAGVGTLFALQALLGGNGDLVTELYLLIALQTAAVHAPRRTAGVLVCIAAALVVFESRGGWSAVHIADAAGHAGIWLLVALIASSLTTQLREQRWVARAEEAEAQRLASTDALTGLGNRRRLMVDLDLALASGAPSVLALFDLDGFKAYNDSFGHPAGDALLRKLGSNLSEVMLGRGSAYRMGGDEFCVLAPANGREDAVIADAAQALNERGEAFTIGASFGFVTLPTEAHNSEDALRSADRRMYANKAGGRTSAGRQTTDVLLGVLRERHPDLGEHVEDVTRLCAAVADRLGVGEEDRCALLQAASLHDVGKAAIPDAILSKAEPLTDDEWAFMRQHTVMGERIMSAAPSLAQAAQLVRSSHERIDGTGYPDGLAGSQIPLGARIICACDAFDAMTSDRPYQPRMDVATALAELLRCAGTQFDSAVVDVLCEVVLAETQAVADSRA